MKNASNRKAFIIIGTAIVLIASAISMINGKGCVALFAHGAQLEILYDSCVPESYHNSGDIGDGEDEKWYLLDNGSYMHHIESSNGPTEIKYYIYDSSKNGVVSWDSVITNATRREYVQNAFVTSICKWDNIFFYKQEGSNTISKSKLVSISPGTSSNNNISIYPYTNNQSSAYGITGPSDSCSIEYIDTFQGISHYHRSQWEINFNLSYHIEPSDDSEFILNRTGAHEFGHVLGLVDIDGCECNDPGDYHHAELLMGYESPSQSEITYKDLIGAAITRGLHTDDDHQWIYHSSGHGAYKLVCSICNSVKYVSSLDGIDYVDYKDCNNEHDLADGNMFAVASYGSSDYYKCKYCRYVAPFEDIVPQNYSVSQLNSYNHLVTNQATGLSYSFTEQHSYNDSYIWFSYTTHRENCACGADRLAGHAVAAGSFNGGQYATCLRCGGPASMGFIDPFSVNELPTSINGSFILPNGIIVLAEADYDAYFNGTLVFNYPNIS